MYVCMCMSASFGEEGCESKASPEKGIACEIASMVNDVCVMYVSVCVCVCICMYLFV